MFVELTKAIGHAFHNTNAQVSMTGNMFKVKYDLVTYIIDIKIMYQNDTDLVSIYYFTDTEHKHHLMYQGPMSGALEFLNNF